MLSQILKEKNIVLGISGGIAAYKTPELVRLLRAQGAHVRVVMTKAALEFTTPLTLQTLSGHTVHYEMFNPKLELDISHISLARWAHVVLIAPATANIIAKLAHGIADDLLTTVCLATRTPIAIVPAMNQGMWLNPITQKNIDILRERKLHLFGPAEGWQACGETGPGRMLEPAEIVAQLRTLFIPPLFQDKNITITAGPTQEPIDPVRYLTNHSSGKMGYAIAEAAATLGAHVQLISGPTALPVPPGIALTRITTAQEMRDAVISTIKKCDIFIAAAAVADYKPKRTVNQKIKKTKKTMTLSLVQNPDILSHVATLPSPPYTVGFAAETEHAEKQALTKLKNKKINMIAANTVGNGQVFGKDENSLIVLTSSGHRSKLAWQSKKSLAYELLTLVAQEIKRN